MLFDLNAGRNADDPEIFDVCVAGAGMAGITIALALAAKGHQVVLLEGGGLDYDERSQDLYRGDLTGRSYFDLDAARLRFFGGTSNHWAGWCRPLDRIDFEKLAYKPYSGWPVDPRELEKYHDQVCNIFKIDKNFTDLDLPAPSDNIKRVRFRFSDPPVRFGQEFQKQIENSRHIWCYLHANLIDINQDRERGTIASFVASNFANARERVPIRARYFVLCLGGIENARILLTSRSQNGHGIGDRHGLVGRFFSEHFHVLGGYYVADRANWPFAEEQVYIAPRSAFQKSRRIGNAGFRISPFRGSDESALKSGIRSIVCYSDLIADFVRTFRDIGCATSPSDGGVIRVAFEQVPNPKSRVTLSDDVDMFGLPRVTLNWHATEFDRRTVVVSMQECAKYIAKNDFGSVKLADWIINDAEIPDVVESAWIGAGRHHMGTTRMAASAEAGVVDPDCRVFGYENLFVAGSSVFPTSGHANPSLTLLELALRLADHLEVALNGRG